MLRVNQFLIETYQLCRCQPRSIKATACITFAALLTLLACILSWREAHSHEPLLPSRTFSDVELTMIEAEFGKAGLNDYYTAEGKVYVRPRQRAKFMEALRDAHVVAVRPDEQYQQELTRSSVLETQSQRQDRIKMSEERLIAECLRRMPEIEEATVHIDEVELQGLHRERMVRAMVAIKTRQTGSMTVERIEGIRDLVAASHALLDSKNVTITDLRTGISYCGDLERTATRLRGDEYIRQKNLYEQTWRDKVSAAVAFIPGVEVIANAHLTQPAPPGEQAIEAAIPTGISISVNIPHSYYFRVRQAQGPQFPEATPDSAAIQRIEQETIGKVAQIVEGLFPPSSDSFQARVFVATVTDLAPEPWPWDAVDFWTRKLRLNPTLVASVLGLAAMVMWLVHGLWRDVTTRVEPATVPMERAELTLHEGSPSVEETRPQPLRESHEIVHRELTRLVREDPETAAEMLGEWVRKAG